MKLQEKVVVVTGGANGIGRALCRRFAAEGARGVVVSDIDFDAARKVADEINGLAVKTDVANEAEGFFGLCDQGYDVGLAGDVGFDREAVDFIRDFPGRVEIDV